MNEQKKIVKKIFHLSRYDFNQHFTHWFCLTGYHAVLLSLLFFCFCFLTKNYDISLWNNISNIVFDCTMRVVDAWVDCFYGFAFMAISLLLFFLIIVPCVIMQNALDSAFDSTMSGMFLSRTVFVCAGITSFCWLVVGTFIGSLFWFGQIFMPDYTQYLLDSELFFYIMVMLVLIFSYGLSFLSMHLLEYKEGVLRSLQQVYGMLYSKLWLVGKTFVRQIFIVGIFLFLFNNFLNIPIAFILEIVVWVCNRLHLRVAPSFLYFLYNFFYVWAYLLMYAWFSLVSAHTYRYLICPPIENISCSSCNSCSK